MDLGRLRREGEGLLARLERRQLRAALGRSADESHASLYSRFGALTSPEAWAAAREWGERSSDEQERARAARLAELAAIAFEGQRTARFLDERAELERTVTAQAAGELLPLHEVPERVRNERTREVRYALSRAFDYALPPFDGPIARRIDRLQEVAHSLGFGSYEALFTAASGIDLAAIAEEAEALLKSTEDAWRDLASYGLRRLGIRVDLKPRGEAADHDLARFSRLEPLDDVFPDRRLRSTSEGLLFAIGLTPESGGRIEVDFEPRPEKVRTTVAALDVPHEVVLVRGPETGARGFRSFFDAMGRAQALAAIHPDGFFEARRLADPSILEGWGTLFANLLLQSGFLKRYLDVDPKECIEAARLLAIDALGNMRRDCAQLLYERTLYAEGPRSDLAGLYREQMQRALFVEWPVERWLYDVEPRFAAVRRLRGRALEAALQPRILDEADEDFWRNPRFGALLRAWFGAGHLDAGALANSLGTKLELANASERLVRIAAV